MRPRLSKFTEDESKEEIAAHESGLCLHFEVRLGIFLHVMAGGSAHDISLFFRVGHSTVHNVFDEVLEVVFERLWFQDVPSDDEDLKVMKMEFSESRPHRNPLPGCVGGISIRIERPAK